MIRLLFALSGGVFVGALALELLTGYRNHPWLWPVALSVAILAFVVVMIAHALRGTALPRGETEASLLSKGRGALARIDGLRQTGTMVNQAHVCVLTLVVAPRDRRAYTTEVRAVLHPVELPGYQPGTVVTVVRPDPERSEVHLVKEPDDEWRRRMEAEGAYVPTGSAAPHWQADGRSGTLIGTGTRGRGFRVVAYIVLFAAGLALPAVLDPGAREKAVAVYIEGDASYDDFVHGHRQQAAMDAVVDLTGSTLIAQATFYSDGALVVMAPSAPGAATIDSFGYRDGAAVRHGPATAQVQDPDAVLFDIAEVDLAQVGALAAEAERLTGIPAPTHASATVHRLDPTADDVTPVVIAFALRDDYYTGQVVFGLDGAVVMMSGGAPGSDAAGE
jgi:hypothetical protein